MMKHCVSALLLLAWFFQSARAQEAASSFEATLRAFQERYTLMFPWELENGGNHVTWPSAGDGTPAPLFPPDGFYASHAGSGGAAGISSRFDAAVNGMTQKLGITLSSYLVTDDYSGVRYWQGVQTVSDWTGGSAYSSALWSLDTRTRFARIKEVLSKLKHVISFDRDVVFLQKESTAGSAGAAWAATSPMDPVTVGDGIARSYLISVNSEKTAWTVLQTGFDLRCFSAHPTWTGRMRYFLAFESGPNYEPPREPLGIPADNKFHEVETTVSVRSQPLVAVGEGHPNRRSHWLADASTFSPSFRYSPGGAQPRAKCSGPLLNSAHFQWPVGSARAGQGEAAIELTIEHSSPTWYTPESLVLPGDSAFTAVRDGQGKLIQLYGKERVVKVVVANTLGYELQFFHRNPSWSTLGDGSIQTSGSPYSVSKVFNPDTSGATYGQLKIEKNEGGVDQWYLFSHNPVERRWLLESSESNHVESVVRSTVDSNGLWTEDRGRLTSGGGVISHVRTTYKLYPWGKEKISEVVDPEGVARTTTWAYFDDRDVDGYQNYGQIKSVSYPDGRWERRSYDAVRRLVKTVEGHLDGGPSSADEDSVVTTVVPSTTSNPYSTTTRSIQGKEVSRSYQRDYWDGYDLIQCTVPGAAVSATGNLVTEVRTYLAGIFAGRVKSVKAPDGTVTLYEYQADAATLEDADEVTTTIKVGVPNVAGTDVVAGTETVVLTNRQGKEIARTVHDIESGLLVDRVLANHVDEFGRPTELEYLDGTKELFVYGCCQLSATVNRQGVQTTFGKSAGTTTTAHLGVEHKVISEGRIVTTSRKDAANVTMTLGVVEANVAGEVIRTALAGSGESLTARVYNGGTRLTQTTATSADGGTRIDVTYPGGQFKQTSGTSAVPIRYEYGADTSGNIWAKAIALDASLNDTPEWSKAWTDMVGRVWKEENPRGATVRTFNAKGQLSKVVDPDGVANLFIYDARGRLSQSVLDVNRNDVVDLAGPDRIVQTDQQVVSRTGGRVAHRQVVKSWAQDASDVATALQTSDVAADGLEVWVETNGLVSHQQTVYSGSGAWTTKNTLPDGSSVTDSYTNGRLSTQVHRDASGVVVDSSLRRYDAAGRLWQEEDARGGVQTYAYDSGDRPQSLTTPKGTVTFGYDAVGRKESTTAPNGAVVRNSFYETGAVQEVYGNGAHPIAYTYDTQGRIKTMTSSSGTTTWEYETDTGWLQKKSDHSGKGAVIAYTDAGRTYSVTNSRGTVKLYDYADSGDLEGYAYSDSITPAVVLGWSRQGSLKSAYQSGELYQVSRSPWGEVDTETVTGGVRDGLAVGRLRDALRRPESVAAVHPGGAITTQVYSYDDASRLETVTSGAYSAAIGYHPQTTLIDNVTISTSGSTKSTSKRVYDAVGNLSSIVHKDANGVVKIATEYLYNAISQRTDAVREDGSLLKWEYNTRGEVTKQERSFANGVPAPHQTEEFEYDDMGNRTELTLKHGRTADYDSNVLNQYDGRSVPSFLSVQGVADTDSRVVVQGKPARRKGKEFWKEWEVDNSTEPVREDVRVAAAKPHGGPEGEPLVSLEKGKLFLPSQNEVFEYDDDGNLTRDDRWAYTWDAEDRLVAMQEHAVSVPASWIRLRLEFSYDAFGRRSEKVVKNWDGSQWVQGERLVFLYDGWNLIAELKVVGSSLVPFRSYVWGLDLNGTDQGLGGIGGLLFAKTEGSSPACHVPAIDGNGNIIGYFDAQNGELVHRSEFDAFGRTSKSMKVGAGGSAEIAANLPFGFSSKYRDTETGLLYFGYRYYNAELGRWISRDPWGEAGGVNLFGFVENDPVNWVDLHGLSAVAAAGGGVSLLEGSVALGEGSLALGKSVVPWVVYRVPVVAAAGAAVASWSVAIDRYGVALEAKYAVDAEACKIATCDLLSPLTAYLITLVQTASDAVSLSLRAGDSQKAKEAADLLDRVSMMLDLLRPMLKLNGCESLLDVADKITDVTRSQRERVRGNSLNQSGNTAGGGGGSNSKWVPSTNPNKLWSKGKLKEHFEKHGRPEFGAKSNTEYSKSAVEFGARTNTGNLIDHVDGAHFYRYDQATGEIFVGTTASGRIKTYYKWDGRVGDDVIEMLTSAGKL